MSLKKNHIRMFGIRCTFNHHAKLTNVNQNLYNVYRIYFQQTLSKRTDLQKMYIMFRSIKPSYSVFRV